MGSRQLTARVATSFLFSCCASGFGAELVDIQAGGISRTYLVHVPKTYDAAKAVPLVVLLHGTNMHAQSMLAATDLERKSDSAGFILVLPNSRGRAFNDGSTAGGPEAAGSDDVGFVESVVKDVQKRYAVMPTAIYLAGFSSGASMVQRMEIESSFPFAAYASVSNALRVSTTGVAHPAPTLLVFGTADPLNPVNGGEVRLPIVSTKPSHQTTALGWAERLGCAKAVGATTPAMGVSAQTWAQCKSGARVEWYEIDGLGHQWAGAGPMPFPAAVVGPQVASPNLSDLMWTFFSGVSQ